jgi:serine/threonine protein kinase
MTENYYKVGDYIEDRYRVVRVLQGAMGKVYVAFDIALDQTVAIKTFITQGTKDSFASDMFFSEAHIWIMLERHPNIVQARSSFLVDGIPFLIVEYVDGGDLNRLIKKGAVDIRIALILALQFCAGAEYAYRKVGLVHRDIKPANLLLTSNGRLKITDFGLSRIGGAAQAKGIIAGTPMYMPPEQWIDAEAVTKQSDIYSFGIVLYEMLTGLPPFKGSNWQEFRRAHAETPAPDPRSLNPTIPADLSAIVMKCLEKNPVHRFFHYDDLADQLKRVLRVHAGAIVAEEFDADFSKFSSPAEVLNSGDSLFNIGKYQEALGYYDQLLELDAKAAKFWQRKAETLRRLRKHAESELYFDRALTIEPSNLDAIRGYVRCLIEMGRQEDAIKICSPALALNPDDRELLKLKQELSTGQFSSGEEWTKRGSDASTAENRNPPDSTTLVSKP